MAAVVNAFSGVGGSFQVASNDHALHLRVSPSGNDASGSLTSPFATIDGARSYLRSSGLLANMARDIQVDIEPGTYRVSSKVSFTDADAATNGHQVIYKATGGPTSTRILGSRALTGWTQYSGSIYRVQLGTPIYTMWEDGVRARVARFPKYVANATYPTARGNYAVSEGVVTSHTVLQYVNGALAPDSWSLTDASFELWSGGSFDWFTDKIPVSSLNLGARQFTYTQSSRYAIDVGSRYFVQGVRDLLTEAGEFYYESSTGYLYYWPTGNIATATIEVPTVSRVFEFNGTDESHRVAGITLDGLSVEQSDFTSWYRHAFVNDGDSGEGHTWPGYDRQMTLAANRQGLVYLSNANGIRIRNCRFKNAGFSGIYGYGYNQGHSVENCLMESMGHSGVYIDGKYPGEGDVSKSNFYWNLKIRNVGELAGSGTPIALVNSGSNRVSHVELYNCPRYALALMAYTDITPAQIYARSNLIEYAKLHDACQDSGDTGGLYFFGFSSVSGGPFVSNTANQVTVTTCRAHPSMVNVAPDGVFFDNQTWAQTLSNISVSDVQGSSFRANDSGGHSLTNTSWNAGFQSGLIETWAIGVTGSFPY